MSNLTYNEFWNDAVEYVIIRFKLKYKIITFDESQFLNDEYVFSFCKKANESVNTFELVNMCLIKRKELLAKFKNKLQPCQYECENKMIFQDIEKIFDRLSLNNNFC